MASSMGLYGDMLSVYPKGIDDVLLNPGIGFNTFQRFNGDALNEGNGWTEGFPIQYQAFSGSLTNRDYPQTTTSYYRIYWRFLEPELGNYRWDIIDKALAVSRERGQTMLLRVAPYSHMCEDKDGVDVPDWYRAVVGPHEMPPMSRWGVDGNNPYYAQSFGRFIRALGQRYDGHPDLEAVDIALIGQWGEGADTWKLKPEHMRELVNAYADSFKKTHLIALLTDPESNRYILSKTHAGYRSDCMGDLNDGCWDFCHMLDKYPQQIALFGLTDAWKKGPVSFESCWVMKHWFEQGWDIDYIIEQSLKWHVSTFNAKSSAVPEAWGPKVEGWLKRMGYRFALRHFAFPSSVKPGLCAEFYSWWENRGVAPCYKNYPLALRLKGEQGSHILRINANIREWLPGDAILNSAVFIPSEAAPGTYALQIAMLRMDGSAPAVRLAIEGREEDGWYTLGEVKVQTECQPTTLPHSLYYE